MLRFRLQTQGGVRRWGGTIAAHCEGQMQVTVYRLIGQFGIERQAGNIDLVVDSFVQTYAQLRFHRGGMGINPGTLRLNFARHNHVVTVGKEGTDIHPLHIQRHIIRFLINIIIAPQLRFASAKIRIPRRTDPHRR